MSGLLVSVDSIKMNCIRDTKDYYRVSQDRWREAIACFHNHEHFAALYLAGYSVECLLKYVILEAVFSGVLAEQSSLSLKQIINNDNSYKWLKDHKLDKLMSLGNDKNVFKVPKESDFQEVVQWTSEWRYAITHNVREENAERFLQSVVQLSEQLKDEMSGRIRLKPFQLEQ